MTDSEIIRVGDVCTYSYDNQNKSLSIVEVVQELSDECVVVKFHQVIVDDSGNGLFTYLCNKGKTMNVSRKYLCRIDLINHQKAEIERYKGVIKLLEKDVADAYDEFAERLKEDVAHIPAWGRVAAKKIDNLCKKLKEEKENDGA